jgi:hypothetical protein
MQRYLDNLRGRIASQTLRVLVLLLFPIILNGLPKVNALLVQSMFSERLLTLLRLAFDLRVAC